MPWSTVIDRGTVALLRTRSNFVPMSFVDAPLGAEAVGFATLVWVDWFHTRRRLVLPTRIERWSLTSLQQRLVKTGGRLVQHARYYWLFLAESHLTRHRFGAMLQRIWALPVPVG